MKLSDLFEDKNLIIPSSLGDRTIFHNPRPELIMRLLNQGTSFRGLADHDNVFLADADEMLHLQLLRGLKNIHGFFDDKKLTNLINLLILAPDMPPESGYGRSFILPNGSKLYTFNKRVEARSNRFLAALMKISEIAK